MPRPSLRHHAFAAGPRRTLGIWLLVLAMACQGLSVAITRVAGAQHRHVACQPEASAQPPHALAGLLHDWLGDGLMGGVMAIVAARQDLVHAARPADRHGHGHGLDGPPHAHAHADVERHTHAQHDPSAQAIGQADGGEDAGLPHAELPWGLEALPLGAALAALPGSPQRWRQGHQAQPRSWLPAPLERPPRA